MLSRSFTRKKHWFFSKIHIAFMIIFLENTHQKQKLFVFCHWLSWSFQRHRNFKILSKSQWSHGYFFEKIYVFCQFSSCFCENVSIIGYICKFRFLAGTLGFAISWNYNNCKFNICFDKTTPYGPETDDFYLFTFLPFYLFTWKKSKKVER